MRFRGEWIGSRLRSPRRYPARGDMGSFDERGYLTLRDLSKDVGISGGGNIYPREVEEVLLTHPGVAEACVVGAPDPDWGEIVVAFIVLSTVDSADPAMLDTQSPRAHRPVQAAQRYEIVDALPKNSYGKVLERELRARHG